MIDRRSLVSLLACALSVPPLIARAQVRPDRVFRLARLGVGPPASRVNEYDAALLQALRELGYDEGRNLTYERRFTLDLERLPSLAEELVKWPADVLVASMARTTLALKQATSTIPIVMVGVGDPLLEGLIKSLARPGGNITGLTNGTGEEAIGKLIQILKETVPGLSRVGVLSGAVGNKDFGAVAAKATRAVGLEALVSEIGQPEHIDAAFSKFAAQRCDGFINIGGAITHGNRQRVADLALVHRIPGIAGAREFAAAGLLMSFGPNLLELFRRLAIYVDMIFRGANPADLPVEQPNRYEMVINLKTAKTLGLKVPQSMLLRATELIE